MARADRDPVCAPLDRLNLELTDLTAAAAQVWPAFALVTGLLLGAAVATLWLVAPERL